MKFWPSKIKKPKIFGAELIVTGGILIFSKFILGLLAPLVLMVYGLYRLFIKKSFPDGITALAFGVLMFIVLKFLSPLLMIPVILGVLIIIYGAILLFAPNQDSET